MNGARAGDAALGERSKINGSKADKGAALIAHRDVFPQ